MRRVGSKTKLCRRSHYEIFTSDYLVQKPSLGRSSYGKVRFISVFRNTTQWLGVH